MKKLLLLFLLINTITKAQIKILFKKTQEENHMLSEKPGQNSIPFSPFSLTASMNKNQPAAHAGFSFESTAKNGLIDFRLPKVASSYNPNYYMNATMKPYPGQQNRARYEIVPKLLYSLIK